MTMALRTSGTGGKETTDRSAVPPQPFFSYANINVRSAPREPQALTSQAVSQIPDGPRRLEVYLQEQTVSEKLAFERMTAMDTGHQGGKSVHRYIAEWDDYYARLGGSSDAK